MWAIGSEVCYIWIRDDAPEPRQWTPSVLDSRPLSDVPSRVCIRPISCLAAEVAWPGVRSRIVCASSVQNDNEEEAVHTHHASFITWIIHLWGKQWSTWRPWNAYSLQAREQWIKDGGRRSLEDEGGRVHGSSTHRSYLLRIARSGSESGKWDQENMRTHLEKSCKNSPDPSCEPNTWEEHLIEEKTERIRVLKRIKESEIENCGCKNKWKVQYPWPKNVQIPGRFEKMQVLVRVECVIDRSR